MNKIYVIIEGATEGSHYKFWELINEHVYQNRLSLKPCSGYKNVLTTLKAIYTKDDLFIIDIDNAYDNVKVMRTVEKIVTYTDDLPNVYNLGLVCFEDTMLSLRYLKKWVYSEQERRNNNIKKLCFYLDEYRKFASDWKKSKVLVGLVSKMYLQLTRAATEDELEKVSVENTAATVLAAFIRGNNFRITKGRIGACWWNNCKSKNCLVAVNPNTPSYKICGMYDTTVVKTARDKAVSLYKNTKIHNEMKVCKNYFLRNQLSLAKNIVVY